MRFYRDTILCVTALTLNLLTVKRKSDSYNYAGRYILHIHIYNYHRACSSHVAYSTYRCFCTRKEWNKSTSYLCFMNMTNSECTCWFSAFTTIDILFYRKTDESHLHPLSLIKTSRRGAQSPIFYLVRFPDAQHDSSVSRATLWTVVDRVTSTRQTADTKFNWKTQKTSKCKALIIS